MWSSAVKVDASTRGDGRAMSGYVRLERHELADAERCGLFRLFRVLVQHAVSGVFEVLEICSLRYCSNERFWGGAGRQFAIPVATWGLDR